MRHAILALLLLVPGAMPLLGQTPVAYNDDFQSYGTQKKPTGWVDTPVGSTKPVTHDIFKTWPDPLQNSKGTNIVYGAKQSSEDGEDEGNGTFSTLTTKTFIGTTHFEYRGRMLRTNSGAHLGLTFFSGYPQKDQYYLIGLQPHSGRRHSSDAVVQPNDDGGGGDDGDHGDDDDHDTTISMQLVANGAGTPTGTLDSKVTIATNKWYRFAIIVDPSGSAIRIRARFWLDGATEPSTWSIDALDSSSKRLTSGRIGVWAAVKSNVYFDDFSAQSSGAVPPDTTPPSIQFFESNNVLTDNEIFNRTAVPEIRVTDADSGVASVVAKLDQNAYTSLTPVSDERLHQLDVDATDKAGNKAHATVHFYVDKSAPVISILENNVPLPSGATFNRDVTPVVQVTDLTPTTVTISLDGAAFISGSKVSAPGMHTLAVTAKDSATHTATASVTFTIDKSGPALTITSPRNGDVLGDPHATVTGSSATAVSVTVNGIAATINTASKTYSASLTLVEGANTITVTGKDSGGNPGTATITVSVDTLAPQIAITSPTAACISDNPVVIGGTVSDAHLQGVSVQSGTTTVAATIVAASGTWSATVPNIPAGKATFVATATDTLGHSTGATLSLTIERAAPVVDLTQNGVSFTATYVKDPVTLALVVNDPVDPRPTVTVTLDGAAYVPGTAITQEGPHTVDAIATNCAGLVGEKKVQFTIDRTPPSIQITESNNPLADNQVFNRDAVPQISALDSGSGVASVQAKLDGNTYTSLTPVTTEALHRLDVDVTDKAGNTSHVTVHFYVDKTAPVIAILEGNVALPSGATFNRDVTPVVQVTDVTATTVTITLDGNAFVSGTTVSAAGPHTLVVKATDSATHTATATVTFTIDRSGPALTITSPKNGEVLGDPHVTVTGSSATAVSVTVNGIAATIDSAAKTYSASLTLSEGANTITASGKDSGGNPGTATITVSVDTLAPQIAITSPTAACVSDSPVVIGGTVADPHLQGVSVQSGSTTAAATVVAASGTWSASIPNLPEGNATFVATATDTLGHNKSATLSLTIDRAAPGVDLTQNGASFTDAFAKDSVALTVVVTDANDPKPALTVSLDNAPYVSGTAITQEGPHTVDAIATNCAGLVGEKKVQFTIDRTAPSIQITESNNPLTDNQIFSRDAIPQISVTDSGSGVATVQAKLDGIAYSSMTAVTTEGLHQLDVDATDKAGNISHVTVHFYVDKTAPVISILEDNVALPDGATFNRDVVPVIHVTDVTPTTVTIALDGSPFVSGTKVTATGPHTLVVQAADSASHTSVSTVTFTIDRSGPALTITSPKNGDLLGDPHVTVTGSSATAVSVTVNGVAATINAAAKTYSASLTLAEGDNTIVASGVDSGGNPGTATITVSVDTLAPQIAITSPTAACVNDSPVVISGTVSDPHLQGVSVQVGSTTVAATIAAAGGTWTASIPNVPEGNATFIATATDTLGHSKGATLALTIDRTAPIVDLTQNGASFTDAFAKDPVTLTVVVTDVNDPKPALTVTLDNAAYVSGTAITQEGAHTVDAIATNCAGLTGEKKVQFTIDRTPPSIRITESNTPLTDNEIFTRDAVPQIDVTDTVSGVANVQAKLDGNAYTSLTPVTIEGLHQLDVDATDKAGNSSHVTVHFSVDKTAPVIQAKADPAPNAAGWNNTNVTVTFTCSDSGSGIATCQGPISVTTEGAGQTVTGTAVDKAGRTSTVTVTLNIDKTAPVVGFRSPTADQVLGNGHIVVTGDADDAIKVSINGVDAVVDTTAKTFTTPAIDLPEGENTLTALATDKADNTGTTSIKVVVSSRAPELTISKPSANACLDATQVDVAGLATGSSLASVKVTAGTTTVDATIAPDRQSWTATIPTPDEGKVSIKVVATDAAGHQSTGTVPVVIDRTKPAIEVTESGQPFTAAWVNHAIALFVRAIDLDPRPALTATLDGQPYVTGTTISAEGAHELRATATDCAGHTSDERIVRFTIDRTPPQILTINPANGAVVGNKPVITGTVSPDAVSLVIEGTSVAATLTNGSFTLPAPLVEGVNTLVLVPTDAAGNQSRTSYSVTVKTTPPVVTITEDGSPIPSNTTYHRSVTPLVSSNDPSATIAATLNSQPFTSGTQISADGGYTLTATATDSFGHASQPATATFTIDRSAATVKITSPVNGASVASDRVDVQGTVGNGVTGVSVSAIGAPIQATISGGTFTATGVPLDFGSNLLIATATGGNGSVGTDTIEVIRSSDKLGILLTAPPDNFLTNHTTTIVAGQVLSPGAGGIVTINGTQIAVDTKGAFLKPDFALVEGTNTITASVKNASGASNDVVVHVTADFTPPVLKVMANGVDLSDGARFATSPTISLTATDALPVTTTLTIDGSTATAPVSGLANGGHSLTAIARDAAGNETRVDRSFVIGSSSTGTGGCALGSFDPANNSAVYADTIKIAGRAGGASSVLVNGVKASLADGSFTAQVTLQVGRNDIQIQCADANGAPTSDPAATLTLYRYTDTTITITSPANGAVVTSSKITVTGTVGLGVVSGDVNGIPFTVPNDGAPTHAFSVDNVAIANGLNEIVARGRTASSRQAMASVRVKLLGGTPEIALTSPLPGTQTGALAIDVSGTYANVDPASITITAGTKSYTATTTPQNDTIGTFRVAGVQLTPSATTTITATGHNGPGAQASASADVQVITGSPSITITSPHDNTWYSSTVAKPDAITGAISAAGGATVQVNGVQATVDTSANYSATIDFASGSVTTPVVARVTTPDGQTGTASIRIVHPAAPLTVRDAFPANNAVGADPGTLVVVLFSNPLDGSTVAGGVHLADAGGQTIGGDVFADKDSITFAPVAPLTPGMTYTFTVGLSLKDLAGGTLASPFTLTFSIATTAPATAPQVDQKDSAGCFTGKQTITGHASVAGARMRLDIDGVTLTTTAAADASFSFDFTLSGAPGFHIARVHQIGADGTLSPEAAVCYRVNCNGPQVVGASLDRTAKKLTIQFSKAMNPATLTASATGTIQLAPAGGAGVDGTVAMNATNDTATVTTAADLSAPVITLVVRKDVQDSTGLTMGTDYTQSFTTSGTTPVGNGSGYVSGAVYDASTGRPLIGAQVDIATPVSSFARHTAPQSSSSVSSSSKRLEPIAFDTGSPITDAHGRYTRALPEGAYTIQAGAAHYTTVWRQIVVPTGVGVIPIDIRLTPRGVEQVSGSALTLKSGGDLPPGGKTSVTRPVELALPAAALTAGRKVALTATGAQSLAGLLPLGWSPLAAAEIAVDGSSIPTPIAGAKLTFVLSTQDIAAITTATQVLSLVQYDSDRDEWRAVTPVASVGSDGRVALDVASSGNFALVYADKAPALPHPPVARGGAALQGVANPCTATPTVCQLKSLSFVLDPSSVLPSGRTVARLTTDGATGAYPSGTAVQAYIDEQLNLADGRVLVDPPFATDLLVYRSLAGDAGLADFHLSPTSQAAAVTLRDGVDHIRVVDYPGRIDRGALIGSGGGRVPGDDTVTIDVPTGATVEALHASVASLSAADLNSFGTIAGFHIAGGFTFTLTRATDATTIDGTPAGAPTLLKAARGTFTINAPATAQVIVAEVLSQTPFGAMLRLAALTSSNGQYFTTKSVDPSQLPVDGIVRDGRYLILVADNPIAFAFGQVHFGMTGPAVANARVLAGVGATLATPLGVADLTRAGGVFAVPVVAKPAAAFSLVPRTPATGDGAVVVSAVNPDPNQIVNVGVLPLTAQAPKLVSFTPADGALFNATDAFLPQATFDVALDPASSSGGIVVTNTTAKKKMSGTVDISGNTVTFHPTEALLPASSYTIVVAASVRSATGTPFGRNVTAHVTTRSVPSGSAAIHPELIHITIPVAGRSTISGTTGALPAGAQAVAVRRGHFFVTVYQATVGGDGSFSFVAGNDTVDRIVIDDQIDLRVIDSVSRAIIAEIPLTPFMSADGTGFYARPDLATQFTTPDGVTVGVPAGAFDHLTLVSVAKSFKSDFAGVPSIDDEMNFAAAIRLDFQGPALKPLELDIPVPAGVDTTNRSFLLGHLGDSSRGPRIMIVDTLTVVNGKFTTRDTTGASALRARSQSAQLGSNETTILGQPVKHYLLRVLESGRYNITDLRVPPGASPGWAYFDVAQSLLELFWGLYHSLYVEHFYLTEGHGRVVVPVVSNQAFTLEGVDITSGLTTFSKAYDPLPTFAPGTAVALPSPDADSRVGPYPVYGAPFRIEVLDLAVADVPLTSIRDFSVTLSGGTAVVTRTTNPSVSASTLVTAQVLNVSNGASMYGTGVLTVPAGVGNRLVLLIGEYDVDPNSDISVAFNEPIALEDDSSDEAIDTSIRKLIKLQQYVDGTGWVDITSQPHFVADSGFRRVIVKLNGELQRGSQYRLRLSSDITDRVTGTATPLKLGQPASSPGSLPDGAYLPFSVREPKGTLTGQYNLQDGVVRDLALEGNVLLVSALNGGLQAFDTSDPTAMAGQTALAVAPAPPGGAMWGLATDHYGRVFSTQLSNMFGILRSYRLQDFIDGASNGHKAPPITSSAIVSWVPGVDAGLPLGSTTTTISDRPEATPRKLQITLIDEEDKFENRSDFESALASGTVVVGATGSVGGTTYGDFNSYTIHVTASADNPYLVQSVSVENLTLGLRWSKDIVLSAGGSNSVSISDVLVRSGDQVRVTRNRSTYGVISLFGYGIGVFDINAMESNAVSGPPATWKKASTLVGVTDGAASVPCRDPDATFVPCPIQSLTFSPEATVVSTADATVAFALESNHGLLDVQVEADPDPVSGSRLNRTGGGLVLTAGYFEAGQFKHWDHPRLRKLRAQTRGNSLIGRFTAISRYTTPDNKTYGIVAAAHFGLLVIDLNLDLPLDDSSLADIIWVPAGAYGVRVIPGSHLATAVDGDGRMLLIDLSRIDERDQMQSPPCVNTPTVDCSSDLFPTVKKAIAAGPSTSDPSSFGSDDPRILWKSAPNATSGTLAPVADPDTGIVYMGGLMTKIMDTIAAVDPHMRLKADLGGPEGPVDIGGITPLGIKPEDGVVKCDVTVDPNCRGSLGAFRVEVALPGGASLGDVPFVIENERIPGVVTQQTPEGFPRANYRSAPLSGGGTEPRPSNDFKLQHVVPVANFPSLKWQRGHNRWNSPWVVAVADPRASVKYTGATTQQKVDAGCEACARPQYLQNDTSVLELWSNGRTIRVRPDTVSFGGNYSYLSDKNRLVFRFPTVMADFSRPADDKIAAENIAPNGAQKEQMVYLHDGEVEAGGTDLVIKGRGLDFVLLRYYSSASFHLGPLGRNFDSPLFARIRALPDGSADYFNGSGRRDRFTSNGDGTFAPPEGIFGDLARRTDGSYVLTEADRTRLLFDRYGRLAEVSDRNRTKTDGSDGNTMRFLYNGDGLLSAVVDASGRQIQFAYYVDRPYLLHTVTDFDGRIVTYDYFPDDRLQKVTGVDPASALSAQQSTTFEWPTAPTSGDLKPLVFIGSQLKSEKDGIGRTIYTVDYQSGANPWSAHTLTMGGGSWTFTPSGMDLSVSDPNSHDWKFTHDNFGNITTAAAPAAGSSGPATTTYGYDSKQRMTSITLPLGEKTTFGYGGGGEGRYRKDGNVNTITQMPRSGSDEQVAGITRSRSITYGPANLPMSVTDADGATTTITRDNRGNATMVADPASVSTSAAYDDFGRVTSITDPRTGTTGFGYYAGTKSGYLNTVVNSAGTMTYTVDGRGNATGITDASGKSVTYTVNKLDQTVTTAQGDAVTNVAFDAAGAMKSRQTLAGVDSSSQPVFSNTTYQVDEVGRVHMQTDNGQVMTVRYDPKGNEHSLTRGGNPPATFVFDARDRLAAETTGTLTVSNGYDDDGALVSFTDGRQKTTTYRVDGFGESVGDISPIGVLSVHQSDASGRPIDTKVLKTGPDGKTSVLQWSKTEYDALGRVQRQVQKLFSAPLQLPAGGSDPAGATDVITRTIYDDMARKVTVIDPRGNATVSQMDELGRLMIVTDAVGNTIEFEYEPNGNKHSETITEVLADGRHEVARTVFTYDDQNRLIMRADVTNPAVPLTMKYTYDVRGNVTSQTDPDGSTTSFEYDVRRRMVRKTAPEGGVTRYEYDDADRPLSITDANGNQTKLTYDPNGNLLSEQRPDGATWSYTYDENFNRKSATDPNGTTVTFVYDDLNRLVEKQITRGPGVAGASHVSTTVDDLGRTTASTTDEGINETMTYDSLGRELSESVQINGAATRTFSRSYDLAGNLVGLTYPSGLQIALDIDKLDRIAAIRDAAAGMTAIVSYSDIGSRMSSKAVANGTVESWSYDPNRRLAEILNKSGMAIVRDVQYQRSNAGDKLAAVRPDLQTQSAYRYNRNHWMTDEIVRVPMGVVNPQPAKTTNYDFDSVLNLRSTTVSIPATGGNTPGSPSGGISVGGGAVSSTRTSFAVNNRNEYTSVGTEALSYDHNGNLTARSGVSLQYDYENRLAASRFDDGTLLQVLYDPMGRKIEEKITSGSITHATDYVLSGDQVKEEYADGSLSRRYVHGRGIDEIVRAEIGGTTVYPIQDELANVERLTDATGATLERYEYDGFGRFNVFSPSGASRSASSLGWKWLFQGREYQAKLGAYDYRTRTLWPDLARFAQEDAAGSHGDLSPYEAFLGSPANLADPLGLYEEDVHHYLTRFLAWKAGFAMPAAGGSDPVESPIADKIGEQTGLVDYDERDAMFDTPQLGKGSLANLENDLEYHFVSQAHLAEMQKEAHYRIKLNQLGDDDSRFRRVGEYLHALEDTYSHQKGKDHREVPPGYGPRLGHSYDAKYPDHTWERPGLANEMAMETYKQLKSLCNDYQKSQTHQRCKLGVTFASVFKSVNRFNAMKPLPSEILPFDLPGPLAHVNMKVFNVNGAFITRKIQALDPTYVLSVRETAGRRSQEIKNGGWHGTLWNGGFRTSER
jgi:RHS repeat-associated protein